MVNTVQQAVFSPMFLSYPAATGRNDQFSSMLIQVKSCYLIKLHDKIIFGPL